MDLWDLLKVAMRQWRVLVPLLVLTFGAAMLLGGSIAPEYSAQGSIVLIGPSETPGEPAQPPAEPGGVETPAVPPSPVNPYLSFNTSLATTAEVLSLRLTSAQAVGALADAGLTTTYEVKLTPRSPIVQLRATGDDAATVVATLDRLVAMAGEELDRLQTTGGAPESQRAAIDVLSQSNAAAPDGSGAQRVRLMVLALGMMASVAVAYATEGLLALRRARSPKRPRDDRDEQVGVEGWDAPGDWDARADRDDRHAVPTPAGHATSAPRGEGWTGQDVEDPRRPVPAGRVNGGPAPVRRAPAVGPPLAGASRATSAPRAPRSTDAPRPPRGTNAPPTRRHQDDDAVTRRPTWPQR